MILENWIYYHGCVAGNVYGDERGRFPDGTLIITSEIQEEYSIKDDHSIVTKNNTYKLGKALGDE